MNGSSITARCGQPLTQPQYQVLARIDRGEDVRAWDIHHTTLAAMIRKHLVECQATTCRLVFPAPANPVRGARPMEA